MDFKFLIMFKLSKILVTVWVLIIGIIYTGQTYAFQTEPELKSAIILNILMFIDWPVSSLSNEKELTLCYIENSLVNNELIKLNKKVIKSKVLNVRYVELNEISMCHAIYIDTKSISLLTKIVINLNNEPILLITDSPGALTNGSMLNLEVVQDKIIFDINLYAVKRNGLVISSKVLRLARKVIE